MMSTSGYSNMFSQDPGKSSVRKSVYAGSWYPGTKNELQSTVDDIFYQLEFRS